MSEARNVAPDGPDVIVVSLLTIVRILSDADGAAPNALVVIGLVAAYALTEV
jgi:hypothetical protein